MTPYTGVGTDAVSVNYNLDSTTFLEGTLGRAWNKQGSYQVNDIADARAAGLANLPLLFPNANVINPEYYGYWALNTGSPAAPYWDGNRVYKAPNFSWGNRITSNTVNGPPNVGLNNLREHPTLDLSVSFTKVFNRHTFKAGTTTITA